MITMTFLIPILACILIIVVGWLFLRWYLR